MTRVTLLLAHAAGKPRGDPEDRIDMEVALTRQGQLDRQAGVVGGPDPWITTRTTPDGRVRRSRLMEADGRWVLRPEGEEDSAAWIFQATILRPGEYVVLRGPDEHELVFRVVRVAPA